MQFTQVAPIPRNAGPAPAGTWRPSLSSRVRACVPQSVDLTRCLVTLQMRTASCSTLGKWQNFLKISPLLGCLVPGPCVDNFWDSPMGDSTCTGFCPLDCGMDMMHCPGGYDEFGKLQYHKQYLQAFSHIPANCVFQDARCQGLA